MRAVLGDQKGMMGDISADGAIVVGDPIFMVMKRKSRNRERKAKKEEADEFSVHQSNHLPVRREK